MKRIVQPELLDTLPPDDPLAIGSRRDLRRVNWWMGNHRIMRRALQSRLAAQRPGRLLELGAGDGEFLLRLAKHFTPPWPGVKATLLDRQPAISDATVAAFAEQGWRVETLVADVFDYPLIQEPVAAVLANLFLHHFEDEALARLLLKISRQTDLFIAVEPHRFSRPAACGQLLRLIGCNAVTLHDAVVSVCAGFLGREIAALWPDQPDWELTERRTGFFSHLFVAQRRR
jgi:SAM-dependent methyltransferase